MAITNENRLLKVSEALGISYSSVRNIILEKNANVVPKKVKKRKRKKQKTEDLRETRKWMYGIQFITYNGRKSLKKDFLKQRVILEIGQNSL